MESKSWFVSHEVQPTKGEILAALHCACNGCRYAVACEEFEGEQWIALYRGGGRTFWTLFLLCRLLDVGV